MMVDNDSWEHDMYDVQQPREPRAPRGGFETGSKLIISNLHYNVSDEDIKELFEELGSLKRSTVHYDKSGRSKGSAEVIFSRKQDALSALRRYNGVRLDGQPMEIEMVSGNEGGGGGGMGSRLSGGPSSSRREVVERKPFGGRTMGGRGGRSGPGGRGGGRGLGGRGGRGGGRGSRGPSKSAADLDAELDSYHDMES